jgi:WD40 repeat protein
MEHTNRSIQNFKVPHWYSVVFDKNGLLASGLADKTINLWNSHLIRTLEGRFGSFAFDKLLNTHTGRLIETLEGHTESVAFDKNGLLQKTIQ